jgi:hypothetical protein
MNNMFELAKRWTIQQRWHWHAGWLAKTPFSHSILPKASATLSKTENLTPLRLCVNVDGLTPNHRCG